MRRGQRDFPEERAVARRVATTQLPPHIATQNVPSAASVMPSGFPGRPRKSETMTGSPNPPPFDGIGEQSAFERVDDEQRAAIGETFMPLGTPRPLATRVGSVTH